MYTGFNGHTVRPPMDNGHLRNAASGTSFNRTPLHALSIDILCIGMCIMSYKTSEIRICTSINRPRTVPVHHAHTHVGTHIQTYTHTHMLALITIVHARICVDATHSCKYTIL